MKLSQLRKIIIEEIKQISNESHESFNDRDDYNDRPSFMDDSSKFEEVYDSLIGTRTLDAINLIIKKAFNNLIDSNDELPYDDEGIVSYIYDISNGYICRLLYNVIDSDCCGEDFCKYIIDKKVQELL